MKKRRYPSERQFPLPSDMLQRAWTPLVRHILSLNVSTHVGNSSDALLL